MKVAIVAGGHGHDDAELLDSEWERWGVNATWAWDGVADTEGKFQRWFELHRRKFLEWEHQKDPNTHTAWMRSLRTLPLYVQEVTDWPEVLTVKAFPFMEVMALSKEFGRYHSCSIDWMIAYAIYLGATDIKLCGVEQWHTTEPVSSRACVEFWSGFAAGRGIHVTSTDGTTFKQLQVIVTDTPYALDPAWLPIEDTTVSTAARLARKLRRTLETVKVD